MNVFDHSEYENYNLLWKNKISTYRMFNNIIIFNSIRF